MLLGIVIAEPILFLRVLSDPINVPKLALLIAGTSAIAGLRAIESLQGASLDGLKRLVLPGGVLIGALFLSWLFSAYRGWALIGQYSRVQGLIPYVVVIVFGMLVADEFAGDTRALARAVLASATVVGFYACIQFVNLDPFSWGSFGVVDVGQTSTLGNPQFTGGFLSIGLPLSITLCVIENSRRTWTLVATVVVAAGWVVSFSQGAWGAGVAGVVLTAGFLVATRWKWAPKVGAAVAALVAAGVIGVIVISMAGSHSERIPITARYRGSWVQEAARMGADSPFVGSGPNTFALRGVHYRSEQDALDFGYTYTDDPHSVPMAFFANAGIVGLAAFIFVVAWVLNRGRRVGRDPIAAAFLGAVVAYLVQALSSIDELSLRFMFWVAIGGLVAATSQPTKETTPRSSGGRKRGKRPQVQPVRYPLAIAAIGLVWLAFFWWSASYVIADARFLQASQLLNEGKLDDAQAQYELAVGFRPDPEYRRRYGGTLGGFLVQAGKVAKPIFPRVRTAFGYLGSTPDELGLVQYGDILYRWSSVDPDAKTESFATYQDALELDPVNPRIRIAFAQVAVDLERSDEALTALEPVEPRPADGTTSVWGLRALASAQLGDFDSARTFADRALALDEGDVNALAALDLVQKGAR